MIRKKPVFERPLMFYDIEVFKEDWLVCFMDVDGNMQHYHNSGRAHILNIINKYTLVGFNNYSYDDLILTKIVQEAKSCTTPSVIKEWNDRRIVDKEHWFAMWDILSLDARQQLPSNMSLKKIQSYNGWNIHETAVDFDIDRKLTDEEMQLTIDYCYNDVKATKWVFDARSSYFNLKEFMYNEICDIKPTGFKLNTTTMTNLIFGGYTKPDKRFIPKDELFGKLPQNVQDYFRDGKMTKDEDKVEVITVFTDTAIFDMSGGGGHGVDREFRTYFKDVLLKDGNGLYPTIMLVNNLLGEEYTAKLQKYVDKRFALKSQGDKAEILYKLLVNSLYGILGSEYYNKPDGVYSKEVRESVCLVGQTSLYDLVLRYEEVGAKVNNINTDGIAFTKPDSLTEEMMTEIDTQWSKDWNIDLSTDKFSEVWQKDVNNYVGIVDSDGGKDHGKIKVKGGYVSKYYVPDMLLSNETIMQPNNNSVVDLTLVNILVSDNYHEIEEVGLDLLRINSLKLFNIDNVLTDIIMKGETNYYTDTTIVERIKTVVDKHLSSMVREKLLEVYNTPFKDLSKKLELVRRDIVSVVSSIKTQLNDTINKHDKDVFEYISNNYRYLLRNAFDKYGLSIFTTTISTTKAYPKFKDTNTDEYLQKVNRIFVSNGGTDIKRGKEDYDDNGVYLGWKWGKLPNIPENSVTLCNNDLSEYQVQYEDINEDYYIEEVYKRFKGYHIKEVEATE